MESFGLRGVWPPVARGKTEKYDLSRAHRTDSERSHVRWLKLGKNLANGITMGEQGASLFEQVERDEVTAKLVPFALIWRSYSLPVTFAAELKEAGNCHAGMERQRQRGHPISAGISMNSRMQISR